MILVKNISRTFGSKLVLDSINLKFEEGKTHVLVGSSGSGKSTLLRILMGLIPPTTGVVEIQNTPLVKSTQRHLALQMGYVIQDGGLFPHLTAEENVTIVAHILKWERPQIQKRLKELLDLVGLDLSLLKKYPKELSGGQKQRVALMRALIHNPPYLLLDEPLGALDPIVRADLQNQLKRIFNTLKKTVLIVTHDVGEAAFFGHTVTLLHFGKVVQHGEFGDFVHKPSTPFVTEFINAQRPVVVVAAAAELS